MATQVHSVLDQLQALGPRLAEASCSINQKIEQLEDELRSYPVEFAYEYPMSLLDTEVSHEETTGYLVGWKKHEGDWRFVFTTIHRSKEVFIERPDEILKPFWDASVITIPTVRQYPKYHEIHKKERGSWGPLKEAPRALRIEFLAQRDRILEFLVRAIKSAVETIEKA